jgi:hypothetical protein
MEDMSSISVNMIPREVWIMILRYIPFLPLICLRLVNSYWRELVYESVISIESLEGKTRKLTDESLQRFIGLKYLSMYSDQPPKSITDAGVRGLKNLTSLTLMVYHSITDTGLRLLTSLIALYLYKVDSISADGISTLTNLTTLTGHCEHQ